MDKEARIIFICTMFSAYLVVSVFLWFTRVTFGQGDCEKRYLDYVFPITKLHCRVNPLEEGEKP